MQISQNVYDEPQKHLRKKKTTPSVKEWHILQSYNMGHGGGHRTNIQFTGENISKDGQANRWKTYELQRSTFSLLLTTELKVFATLEGKLHFVLAHSAF